MENNQNKPRNIRTNGIARLTREMDIARIKEFGHRESITKNESLQNKHKGKAADSAKTTQRSKSPSFHVSKGAKLIRNLTTDNNVMQNVDKKLVEKIAQKIENENKIPTRRHDDSFGSACKEKIIRNLNARVRAKMSEGGMHAAHTNKHDDTEGVSEAMENVKMADILTHVEHVGKDKSKHPVDGEEQPDTNPVKQVQNAPTNRKPAFLVKNSSKAHGETEGNGSLVPAPEDHPSSYSTSCIIPVSKSSKEYLLASSVNAGRNYRQESKGTSTRKGKDIPLSSARTRDTKAYTDVVVRKRSHSAEAHHLGTKEGHEKRNSKESQKKRLVVIGGNAKPLVICDPGGNDKKANEKLVITKDAGKHSDSKSPARRNKKTPTNTHKRNKSKDLDIENLKKELYELKKSEEQGDVTDVTKAVEKSPTNTHRRNKSKYLDIENLKKEINNELKKSEKQEDVTETKAVEKSPTNTHRRNKSKDLDVEILKKELNELKKSETQGDVRDTKTKVVKKSPTNTHKRNKSNDLDVEILKKELNELKKSETQGDVRDKKTKVVKKSPTNTHKRNKSNDLDVEILKKELKELKKPETQGDARDTKTKVVKKSPTNTHKRNKSNDLDAEILNKELNELKKSETQGDVRDTKTKVVKKSPTNTHKRNKSNDLDVEILKKEELGKKNPERQARDTKTKAAKKSPTHVTHRKNQSKDLNVENLKKEEPESKKPEKKEDITETKAVKKSPTNTHNRNQSQDLDVENLKNKEPANGSKKPEKHGDVRDANTNDTARQRSLASRENASKTTNALQEARSHNAFKRTVPSYPIGRKGIIRSATLHRVNDRSSKRTTTVTVEQEDGGVIANGASTRQPAKNNAQGVGIRGRNRKKEESHEEFSLGKETISKAEEVTCSCSKRRDDGASEHSHAAEKLRNPTVVLDRCMSADNALVIQYMKVLIDSSEECRAMLHHLYNELGATTPEVAKYRQAQKLILEERLKDLEEGQVLDDDGNGLSVDDYELLRLELESVRRTKATRRCKSAHHSSASTSLSGYNLRRQCVERDDHRSKQKKGKDKTLLEISRDWSKSERNPRAAWGRKE